MLIKSTVAIAAILMMTPMHDTLPDLKIGDPLPAGDVKMKDVSNKDVTLAGLKGEKGLLVIFSCNTCPFVVGSDGSEGWEGRYPALGTWCQENGVGMVLVNSNEAKREKGDSFADMQLRYREKGYVGNYALDANHVVADSFGARTTPHVYLFDAGLKLAYKGAIDVNVGSAGEVKGHWLDRALQAMLGSMPIDPATTRNMGCSIKRITAPH